MSNDLRQNGLCLVAKRVVWGVITMRSEFERFSKLPLEIDGQADRDLISSKAGIFSHSYWHPDEQSAIHVFRRHL